MGETAQILALWRRARERGEKACLATVVHVEGSSYRKPGARMLVTSGGERAGTISGGCLEAEVSRKTWWLTTGGAAVQQYQSSFDEDGTGVPWGLGCGGTVWLLLEQDPEPVLRAMEAAREQGRAAVVVSRLTAPAGTLAVLGAELPALDSLAAPLAEAARRAFAGRQSVTLDADFSPSTAASENPAYFVEYLAPPPQLTIFGAGDDAQPIAHFADALGWKIAVADGRGHLLRRERFPQAAELRLLHYAGPDRESAPAASSQTLPAGSPVACGLNESPGSFEAAGHGRTAAIADVATGVGPGELAVVLTHSFEQDRALLAALLPLPLAYLGILGPRHRTLRLLEEIAPTLGWTVKCCFERLHAPVGLDLGAQDPASIALAIVAELQATLAGRRVRVSREPSMQPPAPPAPAPAQPALS